MSETLTFGPQWLRNLSSGNSVTSPPPSPGPKYKLAEFRYGKEEMLALFVENLVKPTELEHFSSITKDKIHFPLAFIPPTEEEQRHSSGSVNSNAVLKLMGRGAPRGASRGVRGGIGGRGRGRGDGGYMRQSSYEDGRTDTGYRHDPRRQSWEEGRRGGYDRGGFDRGIAGRGYDPTLRSRVTSDNSWDRNDSDGWRSTGKTDDEDGGGGWRVSGQRDKSDRWRGSKITRSTSWRNSDDKGFPEEEWQVARSGRSRSYHERDENRWVSPSEPEWCRDDDIGDFDITGTFDSSGAFRSQKSVNNEQKKSKEEKNDEKPAATSPSSTQPEEKSPPAKNTPEPTKTKPPSPPLREIETKSTPEHTEQVSTNSTSKPQEPTSPEVAKSAEKDQLPSPKANVPTNQNQEEQKTEEELNMEHFAKAAENLVMSLDDEVEKSDPDVHPPGLRTSPVNSQQNDDIKWFYTDPQGKMQGPFSNAEMADWFKHGYFTMSLMIKRSIDDAFQPLGDLIKSWGRVPFVGGPQPPPYKGIPEQLQQQQQQQQQMLAQQQYQQLLQQHIMQQRFLQQQALMLQQQQHQQLHMQHQQDQQPTAISMATTSQSQRTPSPPEVPQQHMTQEQQAQLMKQQMHHQQQQMQHLQQQQRPQGLGVTSESIWGTTGTTSPSQGMISPGPWSSATTSTATVSRAWDMESGNTEKIQSLQEIQRLEEEKERAIKQENERREQAKRQEEELMRKRQQEYLMQKMRDEEERQKEIENKKREQEELLKRQQEEARRKQEELRKQQQIEHQRQLEQQRHMEQQRAMEQQRQIEQQRQLEQQRQHEQQKRLEEQRVIEMRQQQQQALVKLQQQQQELQRRKELEMQQQREVQQKLQQKRHQNQTTNGSLWGSTPTTAAPSLTEIQQQQEKRERHARAERERLMQQQQQEREQQQRNAPGWADRNKGPAKSLLEIQQEQERQQSARKQNQQLSRSHPSHNPLSSTVWGNNPPSLSASWASNANNTPANAWGKNTKQQPQQTAQRPSRYMAFEENDDDDDDDDDEEEESFWDEAIKAADNARQSKAPAPAKQHPQTAKTKTTTPSNAAFPGATNKTQAKKTNKDEENVRRLFQQQSSASDEFAKWCEQALKTMKLAQDGLDIPTFVAFLKEVDSPYEIHDYVKSYIGDSKEAKEFAKNFIEQKKKCHSQKSKQQNSALSQGSVWGNTTHKTQPKQQQQQQHTHTQSLEDNNTQGGESAANKKKKKKKMQKVDPRILGFSVNAAERVNIGEIQTLEDA